MGNPPDTLEEEMGAEFGKGLIKRTVLGAAAVAALAIGIGGASPAKADGWYGRDWDHRSYGRDYDRDDWRWRQWRHEEWREHHPYGYGYGWHSGWAPRTYYYPAPRVYYPPPAYDYPYYPGGFTVTIPLR